MQQFKDLMGQFASQGANPASHQQQPLASSLNGMLGGQGGLATGAVAGGLVSLLMGSKKTRKFAASAAKIGGAAIVGGLAYKAWQNWQSQKSTPGNATTPQNGEAFLPDVQEERERLARLIIRAMIAAAYVDGVVSPAERARILAQAGQIGLEQQDYNFVMRELERPLSAKELSEQATSPEVAAEIYTASLLAMDTVGKAERAYLELLSSYLCLEDELVAHIHDTVKTTEEKASVVGLVRVRA